MKNNASKGIGVVFFVLLVGYFISNIPDFFREVAKDTGTNENIREFYIDYRACKVATLQELEKNMYQLNAHDNRSVLWGERIVFFKDGFYLASKFYKISELKDKSSFIDKLQFRKFCVADINFDDRSSKNLAKIEDLKMTYDRTTKNEILEFPNSSEYVKNISRLEEQIKDENVFKAFRVKLSHLDFANTDDVDNLIKQIKIYKKIKE